jgi:hypothetical protein
MIVNDEKVGKKESEVYWRAKLLNSIFKNQTTVVEIIHHQLSSTRPVAESFFLLFAFK